MAWLREDGKEVRQMVIHESNVIAHRLQWLLMLQGFLFGGVTLAREKAPDLAWLFPTVGIVYAASAFFVLLCAHIAVQSLVKQWKTNKPPDYDGPPVIGRECHCWMEAVLYPWFVLPILLIGVWIYILLM